MGRANIPIKGCYSDGLLSFYDGNNYIYTLNSVENKVLWKSFSKSRISDIAIDNSQIFIAKDNGELEILNINNGEQVKKIESFLPSISRIKINSKHKLILATKNNKETFIYKLVSFYLLGYISDAKNAEILNNNEIIYTTQTDSLFTYHIYNKKTTANIKYEKPENSNILTITNCDDRYFAVELVGDAVMIKLINRLNGKNAKTIIKNYNKYNNYKGQIVLGYNNKFLFASTGCESHRNNTINFIPCRHNLSDIFGLKVDTIAPVITVLSPEISLDTYTTTDDYILIKGVAKDSSNIKSVAINNVLAPILPQTGEFNAYTKLDTGLNRLAITAIDINNNKSSYYINILKKKKSQRVAKPLVANTDYHKIEKYAYNALIIAEQDYTDKNLKDLSFPILDSKNLKRILNEHYTFKEEKTTLLINPTRNEIIKSLDSLLNILSEKDHLLIFYAGHGIYDSRLKQGYWLPSDADINNRGTWVSNNDIRDYIAGFDAKHILLISDACFSGSIFDFNREADINKSHIISKLLNKKARTAMTSGLDNTVPDKSVFLQYLLKSLIENEKTFIKASDLFNNLQEPVLSNTNNIPQYGPIKNTTHEGGEFIFLKKIKKSK